MLDRDDVLRIAQLEALSGTFAQHHASSCDGVRIVLSRGADERLRILLVSLEIHDCPLRKARRPLPRAEERRSSARLAVHRCEVGASLPADRMRPRARPRVYAAEAVRGNAGAGEAEDPGDEEGKLGPTGRAKPADEEAAERAGAVESVEVDADDPAAEPVGRR